MSTRAIITVKGTVEYAGGETSEEVQRLYAHGDGYPSHVGTMVHNFLKVAPSLGGSGKVQKAAFGDWGKTPTTEGRYRSFSGAGRAYATMHNVMAEPDKFVTALTAYMINKGYGGLYLTDRDPVEEAKGRGTDIEWHYVVTLGPRPKLEVYEYDFDAKRFVKKAASIPELAEQELAAHRKWRAEYAKKQAKEKRATKKRARASGGVRGLR